MTRSDQVRDVSRCRITPWQRFALVGPLLLLAVEVGLLTPRFEFEEGWMGRLAGPELISLALFSMTLFLLLAGDQLLQLLPVRPQLERLLWLVVNVAGFWLLFEFTAQLYRSQRIGDVGVQRPLIWLTLVAVVGLAAVFVFIPPGVFVTWIAKSLNKAFVSLAVGVALLWLTPQVQQTWLRTNGPAIEIAGRLLQVAGHTHVVQTTDKASGHPYLGAADANVILRVTPHCAEMESLFAFLLLGCAVMLYSSARIRYRRLLLVIFIGFALLYVINAVRLFFLVEIASQNSSPNLAVSLAHSRLSGILFLAISALIMITTRPWWSEAPKTLQFAAARSQ